MNTSKVHKHGIALLVTLLMLGNTTMAGWAKSLHGYATEAHIGDVTLGHDAKMTEPTEDYDSDDTIFAEVELAENEKTFRVKGRLHVIEVPGQNAGPIPALDLIVTALTGRATFVSAREGEMQGTADSDRSTGWLLGEARDYDREYCVDLADFYFTFHT